MRLHWKLRKAIRFHDKVLKRVAFHILRQRFKRKQESETIMKRQMVGNGKQIWRCHIVGLRETTRQEQEYWLVQRYRRNLHPNYRELPIMGPHLTKKGIKRARYLEPFYPEGQIFRIAKYNTWRLSELLSM